MGKIKIRTIDITALVWFDKPAANSYFAGSVTVNYQMKGEKTFAIPFQYGYNDVYQFAALKVLQTNGVINDYENIAPWRYCSEKGIILRANKTENCKRSELTEFLKSIQTT